LTEDSGTADNKLSARTSQEKDRMNSEPMKIEALKSRFYGCWKRMEATALHRDKHRKKVAKWCDAAIPTVNDLANIRLCRCLFLKGPFLPCLYSCNYTILFSNSLFFDSFLVSLRYIFLAFLPFLPFFYSFFTRFSFCISKHTRSLLNFAVN